MHLSSCSQGCKLQFSALHSEGVVIKQQVLAALAQVSLTADEGANHLVTRRQSLELPTSTSQYIGAPASSQTLSLSSLHCSLTTHCH